MVAIPLIHGRLEAADYEDAVATDPRVDNLRDKMKVRENSRFTEDYYDAGKRYIGNAIQVFFKDGTATERTEVEFPVGHRKRRAEGIPLLIGKFESSLAGKLTDAQFGKLKTVCDNQQALEALPVQDLMALLVNG
jgi:2-methylcitrate dehydratase